MKDPSQVSVLVAALDPRFRQLKFLSDENKEEVKDELLRQAAALEEQTEAQEPANLNPKRNKTDFDVLLGEEEEAADSGPKYQVEQLFAEKSAKRDTDPLDWWKQNEFLYPLLAKIARSVLSVPATSALSERVFSAAGLTVTKLRSYLNPDNVDALVYLHEQECRVYGITAACLVTQG